MPKERNMSIEAMRICMMFGIVLLHVITQGQHFSEGGVFTRKFINLLSPCVEGFVFISGYFGIRLELKKTFRIVGLAFLYSALFCLPFVGWRSAYDWATYNWFIYGYLVLMLMSPALNAAFENRTRQEIFKIGLPILFAVYGWSYLCVVPWTKPYVPTNTGFAPLSFFTMIGIYTAARMFRLLELENKFQLKQILMTLLFSACFVLAGFHHHNSPFSLCCVACIFMLVKRIPLNQRVSKFVVLIAPSMFAVFLIHSTYMGHMIFSKVQDGLIGVCGVPVFAAYLVVSVVIFCACVVVDGIRRAGCKVAMDVLRGGLFRYGRAR